MHGIGKRPLRAAALGALALAAHGADFSYYMLALSYAPEFCVHAGANRDPRECSVGRPSFVVHGLWPQNDNGRWPERCAPARPVAAGLVQTMLNYFPTESLIQHEWATHGTCSNLSPAEYFATIRKARDSVRIPRDLADTARTLVMSPMEVEDKFAVENPGVRRDAFRVACYPDSGLQEVRICFDKALAPRPCTGSPECTRMNVRLLPMRPRI